MNQRGTQYSEPALTCPEVDQFFVRNLGLVLDAPSTRRLHAEAAAACYRRLTARGTDLGAFNTTENAADFADLRTALGTAQWNVFGVSYGTNLALTLMRQHPQGIRSAIIDSVEPPEIVTVGAFWGNARDRRRVPCIRRPGSEGCRSEAAIRTESQCPTSLFSWNTPGLFARDGSIDHNAARFTIYC